MDAAPPPVSTRATGAALRNLIGAIGVSVAGSLMFLLVPVLVEGLRRHATWLSEQQVGFVGSADAMGMFFGTILALVTAKQFDRRWLAAAGLALLCLSNLGALFSQSYPLLVAFRILAGLGGGLAVGVGHAAFGGTALPDRSIAIYLITQTCIGSAVIWLLSRLVPVHGVNALFAAMIVLGAVACLFAAWVQPRPEPASLPEQPAAAGRPGRPLRHVAVVAFLCLAGNVMLGAAFTAAWANVESLGKSYGFDPGGLAAAISLSLLAATAGSLVVAIVGGRFGRALPFLVITLLTFLGIAMLAFPVGLPVYALALVMMMFGTASTSYIFGALSVADPGGRLPIAHVLSLKAGFAIGPALGSFILIRGGYDAVLLFSSAGTLAVILMGLVAFKLIAQAFKRPSVAAPSQEGVSSRA